MKSKFKRARQVGVTRTRRRQRPALIPVFRTILDGQRMLPVGPIAIFDAQRHRCADGVAVADTGKSFGVVLLDFLAATAAEAELAAM